MLYLLTFISLFIADLLAFNNPLFGKIGTVFWVFSWLFVFSFAAKQFIGLIKLAWDKKLFMTLILVFILGGIVLVNTTNPKNISGETTQEINCMLTYFESSADWGFQKTCLFGYPARQFIIPALPSLIFGRSLFALNFGAALYFIIGLIIFASGILNYLGKNKTADIVTAIILSFIFHIYYFNHFMFFYEQSIYPFCFTLLAGGLFLHYLTDKSSSVLPLIGLSCLYLIYAYTPGLAVYFLLILVLFNILLSKQTTTYQKILIGIIIVMLLISYLLSLKTREDINLIQTTSSVLNIKKDLLDTFNHLIFQNHGNPMVSPVFNFIFLMALFIPLFFVFGWKAFIGSLWMSAVIIISEVSKGYVYYGIDFRLHRATIIFPVLFLIIILIIKPYLEKIKKNYLLIIFLSLFTISGLFFQQKYLNNKPVSRHLNFIVWFKNKLTAEDVNKLMQIYIDNNVSNDYASLDNELQYFIHSADSNILEPNCNNLDISFYKNNFILIGDNEREACLKKVNSYQKYLGDYFVDDSQPLRLYRIN